jgi:hypothetical protein
MTFGFALVLAGFLLVDSGWKGVTPMKVLEGITAGTHGPGGVLKLTGLDVLNSLTPSASGAGAGGDSESEPEGLPQLKTNAKHKRASLSLAHPELHPAILSITAIVVTAFPKLTITSTTSGEHATNSLHYLGRAVDLAPLGGMTPANIAYMNRAAKWINTALSHVLTEGIHNPGLSVKDKSRVPSSFWGSATWQEHLNHIHLGM